MAFKLGFKVTDDKLQSAFVGINSSLRVQYIKGKFIKPQVEGTPLMMFDNVSDAYWYMLEYGRILWLAQYTPYGRVPRIPDYQNRDFLMLSGIAYLSKRNVSLFWKEAYFEKYEEYRKYGWGFDPPNHVYGFKTWRVPQATQLASSVRLLKPISRMGHTGSFKDLKLEYGHIGGK